jgi:hypothetical protein
MWWPFIKHCYLSGSITEANITIWVLDGINNHTALDLALLSDS